jgi:hypothetical protein
MYSSNHLEKLPRWKLLVLLFVKWWGGCHILLKNTLLVRLEQTYIRVLLQRSLKLMRAVLSKLKAVRVIKPSMHLLNNNLDFQLLTYRLIEDN